MPVYETIYIAQPELPEADADALGDLYEQLIKDSDGGNLTKTDRWGKKKLAYPVRKHAEGLYYHMQYEAAPETVTELERRLRHNEKVIKFLSVKLTRQAIVALAEAEKKAAERAAARAQREAERAARLATEQENEAAAAPEKKETAAAPAPAAAEKKEAAAAPDTPAAPEKENVTGAAPESTDASDAGETKASDEKGE